MINAEFSFNTIDSVRADEGFRAAALAAAAVVPECFPGSVWRTVLSAPQQARERWALASPLSLTYPTFHMVALSPLLRVGVRVVSLSKQYYTQWEETVSRQGLNHTPLSLSKRYLYVGKRVAGAANEIEIERSRYLPGPTTNFHHLVLCRVLASPSIIWLG